MLWAYLWVFLGTAGAVALAMPLVLWLARKLGAIDRPSDRKVHPKPTPTLGGIGILAGGLARLGGAYLIPSLRLLFQRSSEIQGTIVAAAGISGGGVVGG